jgi:hypothetical protein
LKNYGFSRKNQFCSLVLLILTVLVVAAFVANPNTSASTYTTVQKSTVRGNAILSPPGRLLSVPYVGQGNTSWCYQASLAMVLAYRGEGVELDSVVAASGNRPNQPTSLPEVLFGRSNLYVSRFQGLSAEHNLAIWSFAQYAAEIDTGNPVIVSSFGEKGHTIVVVGYAFSEGNKYLYINDPSGFITDGTWNLNSRYLARVKWEDFANKFWVKTVIHDYRP